MPSRNAAGFRGAACAAHRRISHFSGDLRARTCPGRRFQSQAACNPEPLRLVRHGTRQLLRGQSARARTAAMLSETVQPALPPRARRHDSRLAHDNGNFDLKHAGAARRVHNAPLCAVFARVSGTCRRAQDGMEQVRAVVRNLSAQGGRQAPSGDGLKLLSPEISGHNRYRDRQCSR